MESTLLENGVFSINAKSTKYLLMTDPDLVLEISFSSKAKAGRNQQPQANTPPVLDRHRQAVLDPSERPGQCQGATLV